MAVSTIKPAGGGDFTSLEAWQAAVAAHVGVEDAECYKGFISNDILFDSTFLPSSSRIYAHASARHAGVTKFNNANAFAVIDASTRFEVDRGNITLEGLVVQNGTLAVAQVLAGGTTTNLLVDSLLFIGDPSGDSASLRVGDPASFYTGNNTVTVVVRNCIFHNTAAFDLILVDSTGTQVLNVSAFNCTSLNSGLSIQANKSGATAVTINVTVQNVFATSFSTTAVGGGVINLTADHNASIDPSATGTGSLINQNRDAWFFDTANALLLSTSPGRDAGTTIGGFSNDVRGQSRPVGSAWDIGAFEFNPATDTLGGGGGSGGNNIIGG